jgi:hypothetical protein
MKFSAPIKDKTKINCFKVVFFTVLVCSFSFGMIDKGHILRLNYKDASFLRLAKVYKDSMPPLPLVNEMENEVENAMERKVQTREKSWYSSTSERYRHRKRSTTLSSAPSMALKHSWQDDHDYVVNSSYENTWEFHSWWKTRESKTNTPSPQPFVPPTSVIPTGTPDRTWNALSLKVRCIGDVWVGIGGPVAHQDSTIPILRTVDRQQYSNPVITKDFQGTNMTFVLPILSETVSQGVIPLLWEYGLYNNTIGIQTGSFDLQVHRCHPASKDYMTLSACNPDDKNYDQMNVLAEGVTGPIAVLYTKLVQLP